MAMKIIRFAIACLLGMIPSVFMLYIFGITSRFFKYAKKYKFLDWLDRRFAHLIALTFELWLQMLDIKVYVLGEERSKWVHQPTVILSNHSNALDSLLMTISGCLHFQRSLFYHDMEGRFQWVRKLNTDREHYFGKRDGTDNAANFKQHLKNHFFPMYQICAIFPEGGVLKRTVKKSEAYGKANNIPLFRHLAIPHIKGMKAILDALANEEDASVDQKGQLKWVADQTFLYPDPDMGYEKLFQGVMKKTTPIYIYTKLYDVKEVPRDTEQLTKWIYERFREKDDILENYKVHGKLPADKPHTLESPFAVDVIIFYSVYLFGLYSFIVCPLSALVMKCF